MKIKDLKVFLDRYDPELEVIVSGDGEGNSYDILRSIDTGRFEDEYYSIRIGLEKLTPELEEQGFSDDDVLTNGKPCIILYP